MGEAGLREGKMARIVDCPCGITLSAADDGELFRLGRQHADEHHRDDGITDEFIRDHVAQNARDSALA
jgi:predicted small metal-binding protein